MNNAVEIARSACFEIETVDTEVFELCFDLYAEAEEADWLDPRRLSSHPAWARFGSFSACDLAESVGATYTPPPTHGVG